MVNTWIGRNYTGTFLSLRVAVGLIAIGTAIGVTGFMVIEGYSFAEAFYMTVITVSTVGYGEVRPLSTAGRWFASLLIVVNIGIFAYLLSAFSYYVVQGEFFRNLHLQRVQQQIDNLKGHIILCGYGRLGREAVRLLKLHNLDFVVIEIDPEEIKKLRELDVLYIEDDATHEGVLEQAGIHRAESIISSLPEDTNNVYTVLTARDLNPGIHIVARSGTHATERRLRIAGADHVILPEQIGGFYMASLITKPNAVEFFAFITNETESDIGFEELRYDEMPDKIRDKAIRDLTLRPETGANIIGIKKGDGSYVVNPGPDEMMRAGTSIIVLGDHEQLEAFRAYVKN